MATAVIPSSTTQRDYKAEVDRILDYPLTVVICKGRETNHIYHKCIRGQGSFEEVPLAEVKVYSFDYESDCNFDALTFDEMKKHFDEHECQCPLRPELSNRSILQITKIHIETVNNRFNS